MKTSKHGSNSYFWLEESGFKGSSAWGSSCTEGNLQHPEDPMLTWAAYSNLMLKQVTKHVVQSLCRSALHNGVQCRDAQDSSRTGLADLKSSQRKVPVDML